MPAPNYYDVHWYGPYSLDEAAELDDPNLVLYMICGTHGMYGKNVPLYIGKTLRSIRTRMKEHSSWLNREPDPAQIYTAAISAPFTDWSAVANVAEYPPRENATVEKVESLLIYAHQPVYNNRSRFAPGTVADDFIVFNTGRRSTLFPELSTMYWYR